MDQEGARRVMRWAMVVFYCVGGAVHLWAPDVFLPVVPAWVPAPRDVVIFTGICEIAGATALVTRPLRWWAGVMLAIYAVCVYPANIKHAIDSLQAPGWPARWWYHGPRLAAQPVIVWWALFCGRVVDWPFRRETRP
jgi:uncharacterized membrane protein